MIMDALREKAHLVAFHLGHLSGNFGQALRASMSVSAAMAPVEIEGQLLVDGGISINLPVT